MRKFRLVNYADWGIDRSVSRARRARLLGKLSFEAIVERLLSEVRIMRITHEKGDNTKRGLHRWVITLIANPHTIDLWHNSRGGYRCTILRRSRNWRRSKHLCVQGARLSCPTTDSKRQLPKTLLVARSQVRVPLANTRMDWSRPLASPR